VTADWTNLILGPELHRGRLGHLLRAARGEGPGPTELVLRLTDARLEPALRDLVMRESALAVRIASPFVVAHEPVTQDPERPFAVMARIDGLSLHTLLLDTPAHEAGRLLLPAALDAIEGLVAVHAATDDEGPLHAVHQAPVPRHIVVGVDGIARLIDLTQAVSRAHPYIPALQTVLRAEELAPEQVARGEHVDARTDVFIAADTFFRVLTGTPALARSAASRSRPPGASSPGRAGAQLSPELQRVLSWALAADPATRPGSAQGLLEALREALAHTEALATREELGAHVRRLQGERASAASTRASTLPFASTYAMRTGAETREGTSTPSSSAPPASSSSPASAPSSSAPQTSGRPPGPQTRTRPSSASPQARSGGPHAPAAPARRDYWFALYRDEHSPGDGAPQAPAPTAHERGKPSLASTPPAPLDPDDTWARKRAELGPVLYVAPPWSSPPPSLSPPDPDTGARRARTKTAILTGLTVLGVSVATMMLVGWLDSPTSSASQARGAAPAPAAAEPVETAPSPSTGTGPTPTSADRAAAQRAASLASEQSPEHHPAAVPRLSVAKGAVPPARRAVAAPAAKARAKKPAASEPPMPTLTREDFLPGEPASP
jgi:hypothetical protein